MLAQLLEVGLAVGKQLVQTLARLVVVQVETREREDLLGALGSRHIELLAHGLERVDERRQQSSLAEGRNHRAQSLAGLVALGVVDLRSHGIEDALCRVETIERLQEQLELFQRHVLVHDHAHLALQTVRVDPRQRALQIGQLAKVAAQLVGNVGLISRHTDKGRRMSVMSEPCHCVACPASLCRLFED